MNRFLSAFRSVADTDLAHDLISGAVMALFLVVAGLAAAEIVGSLQ